MDRADALAAANPSFVVGGEMDSVDEGGQLWLIANFVVVQEVALVIDDGQSIVMEAPYLMVPGVVFEADPVQLIWQWKWKQIVPMAYGGECSCFVCGYQCSLWPRLVRVSFEVG
mgnify:CR=1 FL=1